MDLSRLIEHLSRSSAYPHPADPVEVRQTHISVVFLAGAFAYKVKKPVSLSFVDYGTLDRRRHFCHEEVRLNRRLAPEVYLGVVPITFDGRDAAVEGPGEIIEWAVKMLRLPAEATLESQVRREVIDPATLETLARRLAEFHASAETSAAITACGRYSVVAANARENFREAEPHIGRALSRRVFDRFRELTEADLANHRAQIEARAEAEVPRDTHGDLRLEHVYRLAHRLHPEALTIVDCVEFNERFRYADPVSDMAFLAMDLAAEGRRDLAAIFVDAYFRARGDDSGRRLLPFYVSYRAAVRGKVGAIKSVEPEVSPQDRARALANARAHWLIGLGALETPERAPALLLIGGLPGTGKSTIARELASTHGFTVIRSDEVRKQLAERDGVSTQAAAAPFGQGLYTSAWTQRTYEECLRRAEAVVFEAGRALIDASFRQESFRRLGLETAQRWGVPTTLLLCEAEPEIVRQRLDMRRGDASDADWTIYQQAAASWEPLGAQATRLSHRIETSHDLQSSLNAVNQALDALACDSTKW